MLTAAIVVFVLTLSLTLTYRALVEARADTFHARFQGFLTPLITSADQTTKARKAALQSLASNAALHRAIELYGKPHSATVDSAAATTLERLRSPNDSGLPIELWTNDGRRVAHIGADVPGDTLAMKRPEMRPLRNGRVSQVPTGEPGLDSVQFGALYPSHDRVYSWAVGPVMKDGHRIGYLAQQRRVANNPQTTPLLRGLSGEDVTVYLRNATDGFWASIEGTPVSPPTRQDTTPTGFIARHGSGQVQIAREAVIPNTPYVVVVEAPQTSLFDAPRATIRRIAFLSFFLLLGGVVLAWVLSRQVTRPLVELTTATEAMAAGDFDTFVEAHDTAADEVLRLGTSFNRMAGAVKASQVALASQYEEARATSDQLEHTNLRLQDASVAADEARDAALRANQAKSDFLAVMSHELRTPLNAIGGYTEILRNGIYGPLNEAQEGALIRVARSQQMLLSLINDVLNFTKLEAGAVQYLMRDVRLGPAVSALEELVAPQLRDRRQHYVAHPCDARVVVRADSDKLQQILINLLSNAIKYTPEGGSIEVGCEFDEVSARVYVTDTGIGIAAEQIENIFDPFIQVGRALNRPHDGVGLGLSISRDLAAAMGGSLSVRSEVGRGSTFTLTLERWVEEAKSA